MLMGAAAAQRHGDCGTSFALSLLGTVQHGARVFLELVLRVIEYDPRELPRASRLNQRHTVCMSLGVSAEA
jgi:hypothetical protein